MPEWYKNLLAYLTANNIAPDTEVGTLFLAAQTDGGELIPLFDFLRPSGSAEKSGWEMLSRIMDNTKPLNSLPAEDIDSLHGLIGSGRLWVLDKRSECRSATPLQLAENDAVLPGETSDVSGKMEDDYRWLAHEHKNSIAFMGEHAHEDFTKYIYKKDAAVLTAKYGLTPLVGSFLYNYGIDPHSLEELPCVQGVEDDAEKGRRINAYISDVATDPASYLTPEERAAIDAEEIEVTDLRILAYNQGVSVQTYVNRLRGIEALPAIDYGEEGQAPTGEKKTEDELLNEAVANVDRELREKAKNPFEMALAETMIELKHASFEASKRSAEMERLFARYISLKAAENYLGIKPGEEIPENDPRNAKISELLAAEKANTEKILADDTFKYYVQKLGAKGLSELSRGTDAKPMNDAYTAFCKAQKDKVLNDPINALDFAMMKRRYINSKAMYFPDKAAGDKWIVSPANPFGLSADRTAIVTFACGKMLQKGYDLEDILSADKLAKEKLEAGKEAYEQAQVDTPENRESLISAYMATYEKCIEAANRKLNEVDSIDPAAIMKAGKAETFYAIGNYMKDAFQELDKLDKKQPFPAETKEKFKKLAQEGELVNYIFDGALKGAKGAVEFRFGAPAGDCRTELINLCSAEYQNTLLPKIKKAAAKENMTISAFLAKDMEKNHGTPNSLSTQVIQGVAQAGMIISKGKVSGLREERLDKSAKNRKKIASDFVNGTFGKKLGIKTDENGMASAKLADYLGTLEKQKTAAADQPALK